MSKLVVMFVLFMSGTFYNPPRALQQVGPEAAALTWRIASSFGINLSR